MNGAQETPMTEPAEDPTEPTPAKEWKTNARAARRPYNPQLLGSLAAVRQMQSLVTRSPALLAVQQLQNSGALSRVAEQVQVARAAQALVAGSSALRAVEEMQRNLAATTWVKELARPNPVFAAAAKFQHDQIAAFMPAVSGIARLNEQVSGIARLNEQVSFALMHRQQAIVWSTVNVATRVNAMLAPLQDSLRIALDGWMHQWADLARFGTGLARRLARGAIFAALRARRAVMHGHTDELDAFITEWLDQPVTSWRRDAVAVVLLEDDWLEMDLGFDDDSSVVHHIKTRASLEARNHKFIEETQLRGHRVVMLDRPVRRPGGEIATLSDLLVDPSSRKGLPIDVGFDDDRLNVLLGRLKPDEQAVVIAYGDGASETWESAAIAAGLPPEYGERVRRKCKRERDVIANRAAAASRATQPGLINYGRR
jgi:hypothetical protein